MMFISNKNSKEMVEKIIYNGSQIIEVLSDNNLDELEGVYTCAHVASYLLAAIIKRNNLPKEDFKKIIYKFISDAVDSFIKSMPEEIDNNNEIKEIIKSVKWED